LPSRATCCLPQLLYLSLCKTNTYKKVVRMLIDPYKLCVPACRHLSGVPRSDGFGTAGWQSRGDGVNFYCVSPRTHSRHSWWRIAPYAYQQLTLHHTPGVMHTEQGNGGAANGRQPDGHGAGKRKGLCPCLGTRIEEGRGHPGDGIDTRQIRSPLS
jgi:hypothetical protein